VRAHARACACRCADEPFFVPFRYKARDEYNSNTEYMYNARACTSVRECACIEYYPKNKERRKAHEREGGVRRRGNALVLSLHVPGFPPIFDIAHIQRRLVHLFLFLRLPRQPPHLRSGASQRTSTGLQLGHCSLHPTVQANG